MDEVFKALADPTRRNLLDRLRDQDGQTLTELEESVGAAHGKSKMTRFGVMKHLKILEDASLVVTRRSGRFKHHYLNAVPLQEVIDRWIEPLTQKPLARFALDLKAQLEGDGDMASAAVAPENTKPDFVLETFIRTTPKELWGALTKPHMVSQYYIANARPEGEFVTGGRVVYSPPGGDAMVSGDVLEASPYSVLEMTFESAWAGPDVAPTRMRYEIEEAGDACKLTILHFDIPPVLEGVKSGWSRIAAGLKTLLETGTPLSITVDQG